MLKEKFNEGNKCLECGVVFKKDTNNKNYLSFISHLKKDHNISNSEYYLKHYLNNKIVLCGCGCGKKTNYFKGKFLKYYSNHKNFITPSEDTLFKVNKSKKEYNNIDNLIKKTGISFETINRTFDEFIRLEKPISVLSKDLFIDFRTLKSYWFKLGLIKNKEEFKRISLKSKVKWMVNPLKPNDTIINILNENILILKKELESKEKLTFNDIITIIGVDVNKNFLSFYLKEKLSYNEIKKIKFIKQSQIEIEFQNVLKFYFGKSITGSFELDGRVFDYKLGNKILIELDGEYWHSKEEAKKNDLLKNKIAEKNKLILIRVNDKEVKSLGFINKLKKIYDEFK